MTGRPRQDRDRLEFPRVSESIGEDPARYLDVDGIESLRLARARIRGIDRIEVVRAWIAVERRIASILGRDPRDHVLEWLEEREATLEEIGERPDRLEDQDRREPGTVESVVDFSDRDGTYPFTNEIDADRYRSDADDSGIAQEPRDRAQSDAVATDGGSDQ